MVLGKLVCRQIGRQIGIDETPKAQVKTKDSSSPALSYKQLHTPARFMLTAVGVGRYIVQRWTVVFISWHGGHDLAATVYNSGQSPNKETVLSQSWRTRSFGQGWERSCDPASSSWETAGDSATWRLGRELHTFHNHAPTKDHGIIM